MELDPGVSLGVDEIDVQHRQILHRARQVELAVREGRPQEARAALRFLHAYLAEHFAAEERWMAEEGYPGYAGHARIHTGILDAVTAAREDAFQVPGGLAGAAADLAAELERHLLSDDLKVARFHAARENLRLLAEAGPGVGACLTPIPGTLEPLSGAREPEHPARSPRKPGGAGK